MMIMSDNDDDDDDCDGDGDDGGGQLSFCVITGEQKMFSNTLRK